MEEKQTILAAGAGGASKFVLRPDRIERVENVKDVAQYMARIDEMMEEYRNKEFVMPSFVSPKNTEVDAVQFVMKVAEIEVEETPVPPEEEAEQPGFLQKLKKSDPVWKKRKTDGE